MEVVVLKASNVPPKADAGKDQVIILPSSFIKLDGSKSSDDKGIETYAWTRDVSSPAAGENRFSWLCFSLKNATLILVETINTLNDKMNKSRSFFLLFLFFFFVHDGI